jgi:4-coumarate--CoA ligase
LALRNIPRVRASLAARGLAASARILSPYPPLPPVEGSLDQLVTSEWHRYADEGRFAVLDETGASRTFGELIHDVSHVAGGLQRRGIGAGDVVAVVSPNHIDYGTVALATLRLGAVLMPANPAYTLPEVRGQLERANARVVVAHLSTIEMVLLAVRELPAVDTVACFGSSEALPPDAVEAGVIAIDEWRNGSALVTQTAEGVGPSTLGVLPFSSGTTGLPKGTMLLHSNLMANMRQFMAPEGAFIPAGAPVICPLPVWHIYGFTVALLFMLWRGHPLVTMARFDLATFCKQVSTHRPARAYLVPPILLALAKHPMVAEHDFSSLSMISSAAAPLDAELEKACARRLRCGVKQAWGMSELSPLGTWPADTDLSAENVGTVGPPVSDTMVRIVELQDEGADTTAEGDDAQLLDVPPGCEGELLVSGPQVMAGYLNMPEATAKTLVKDADGSTVWLRTGDVARVDERGFVYITDRAKELIKYKGFQVAPAELEAILLTHPHVNDCAVIPVADPEAGEVPRAYVVLRGAPVEPSAAECNAIADFVAGLVAPHKRLRGGVVVTSHIPKSASGKILRRLVRDADRAREHERRHHDHAERETE